MRSWSVCLLASVLALAARDQEPVAGPLDARALFESFARMPGLEARFVEEKHLALLALPLKSQGRLYFLQPGYLTRVVEKPQPATLTISPDELRVSGPDGVEVIDLRRSDELRLFVTSLVRVFSGEREQLERSYQVVFEAQSPQGSGWTLTLTPHAKPLSNMVRTLRLRGQGLAVERIEVLEPNGDRTVTRIEDADPKRRFTDEERTRLFGIAPR